MANLHELAKKKKGCNLNKCEKKFVAGRDRRSSWLVGCSLQCCFFLIREIVEGIRDSLFDLMN